MTKISVLQQISPTPPRPDSHVRPDDHSLQLTYFYYQCTLQFGQFRDYLRGGLV